MWARVAEPEAGEAHAEGHGKCLNCGTLLAGPHCHQCGQAAHVHRSISAFWHDILHGVLHFDGKFWNTLPLLAWRRLLPFGLAFPTMTWGGLRGGISIALALSLPPGPMKDVLLAATYVVVLFSVLAQGGTIERVVRRHSRVVPPPPEIA